MQTQFLGQLDLDLARLHDDLQRSSKLTFAEPYGEFPCGRPWKSCMLWAPGGTSGDNIIDHFDMIDRSEPTSNGEQLPYITELMANHFATEHLLFARLILMSESLLIPHRDYVELTALPAEQRAGHRLHVPLATDETCLFTEDNLVFRMGFGQVWVLDVSRQHSAAVLSDFPRMHLMLDFAAVDDGLSLVRFDVNTRPGIPESAVVPRPPLSPDARDALLSLSEVVDQENLRELISIVAKKHYRHDGGDDFVWGTIREIARRSPAPEVADMIEKWYTHCTFERVTD